VAGRHTDSDRGAFWRSLAVAAVKALLVLVVLAGVTALVALYAGTGAAPAQGEAWDGR
jgi:hypothetical protein